MTGECFGWSHGDTSYFNQGGFDSMINFAFNGTEGGSGRTPSVDDWKYYSGFCNGVNGHEVLNYVSSHDTGLHRPGDQKNVATMLLLCPGGAQIFTATRRRARLSTARVTQVWPPAATSTGMP